MIIQLATKQIADWLCEPFNKIEFTNKFEGNVQIKDRAYPLLVPRIPLTFDPSNPEHIHEIEEANNLAPFTISKARSSQSTGDI